MFEEGALAAADVGDLDHGAAVSGAVEIGEPPPRAADLSLMADDEARRDGAVVERLIVVALVRHVLHALAVIPEVIAVHRRRVVALLDQFDLQVAGIGQRDAHLDR